MSLFFFRYISPVYRKSIIRGSVSGNLPKTSSSKVYETSNIQINGVDLLLQNDAGRIYKKVHCKPRLGAILLHFIKLKWIHQSPFIVYYKKIVISEPVLSLCWSPLSPSISLQSKLQIVTKILQWKISLLVPSEWPISRHKLNDASLVNRVVYKFDSGPQTGLVGG